MLYQRYLDCAARSRNPQIWQFRQKHPRRAGVAELGFRFAQKLPVDGAVEAAVPRRVFQCFQPGALQGSGKRYNQLHRRTNLRCRRTEKHSVWTEGHLVKAENLSGGGRIFLAQPGKSLARSPSLLSFAQTVINLRKQKVRPCIFRLKLGGADELIASLRVPFEFESRLSAQVVCISRLWIESNSLTGIIQCLARRLLLVAQ